MKQIIISIILSSTFTFFCTAQSKIYFEERESEFILDIADGLLLKTDSLFMKNEHQDTIKVNWFFTLNVPMPQNPDNTNLLDTAWTVLLCDELLCHSLNASESIIPPQDTYGWSFSISQHPSTGYKWILGEGSVTLNITNVDDANDTASLITKLKIIDSTTAIMGCTDANACNYNMDATEDNNSCNFINDTCADEYGEAGTLNEACACVKIMLCANQEACNNNEAGDCLFTDCAGECGGSATEGSACTDTNGNESIYDSACACVEIVAVQQFKLLNTAIFPNPSNGLFNLQFKDASHQISTIKVNNLQGQTVVNLEGLVAQNNYQIDLSKLVKGLYQIQLLNKEGKLLHAEIIDRQ